MRSHLRVPRLALLSPILALPLLATPAWGQAGQAPAAGTQAAAAAPAQLAPGDCRNFWSRYPDKQSESSSSKGLQTVKGTAWTDLDCGTVTVQVPRGQNVVATVWVNAEIRCKGTSAASNYCRGRVLANGTELAPIDSENGDVFTWDTAAPEDRRWRDGSMIRTGLLSCPSDHPTTDCDVKITAQASNNSAASEFWIDNAIVHAQIWKSPPGEPVAIALPRPASGQTGYFRPAFNEQLTVEVKDGGDVNRTPVQLGVHAGATKQQWAVAPAGQDQFFLRNPLTKKCLDIGNKSKDNNAPLNIWDCDINKYPEQGWQFRDKGDGTFDIYSPYADKCVDQGTIASGLQLVNANCTGGPSQKWKWTQ